MKIYTGFGDKGKTKLYGGEVVNKNHPRVEIYGTLDELNSWLGLILSFENDNKIKEIILKIQNDIFNISSIMLGLVLVLLKDHATLPSLFIKLISITL